MKQQALQQAQELGQRYGQRNLEDGIVISVVDVVDECPACGEWLDTLTADAHQFNEAHAEIYNAYSTGYTSAAN